MPGPQAPLPPAFYQVIPTQPRMRSWSPQPSFPPSGSHGQRCTAGTWQGHVPGVFHPAHVSEICSHCHVHQVTTPFHS